MKPRSRARLHPALVVKHASTAYLRVPHPDWPRVRLGAKTEFRTRHREACAAVIAKPPTPVVAYAENTSGTLDYQLMVLEDYRYEPVFNVSLDPEAVAREGFDSYDEFRRYWRARCDGAYMPTEKVWVWRLRPLAPGDLDMLGASLVAHLYGKFMAK